MALPTVEELADEIEEVFNSPEDEKTGALMKLITNVYLEGCRDRQLDKDVEVFARAVTALLKLTDDPFRRVSRFASRFSKDELQEVADFLSHVVAAKSQ
jgi:hypothetical protein